MTRAPFVMAKGDKPFSRTMELEDTVVGWRLVNPRMQALYRTASMPETGENVAERYHVTRDEQDIYALQSQKRTAEAQANGYFAEEIEPVRIFGKKQDIFVTVDEHPRPETTLDALKRLRPVARPEGTVTAGNASGLHPGAAAVVVASSAAASPYCLTPRPRTPI